MPNGASSFTGSGSSSTRIAGSVRRVENWLYWICADVIAIGVYWAKDLNVTSGLYAVFLAMAIAGLVSWNRRAGVR